MAYINLTNTPEDLETGVENIGEPFDLGMEDDELIFALSKRIADSRSFWEEDQKLKERRKLLEDYWRGKHRIRELYDYQYPAYVDNRVYMHVEHIAQVANSQLAEPVVTSFSKAKGDKDLANAFGEYLLAYAQNHGWLNVNRIVTRNLLLQFIGIKKIFWDDNMGPISRRTGLPMGNVNIEFVRPANIIIDRYAKPFSNPPVVTEIVRKTVEQWIDQFPDKKDVLQGKVGKGKMLTLFESHFTYLNEDGAPREGVVWFSELLKEVIHKTKDENWDETGELGNDGLTTYKNMLEMPGKPYSFLTMNNLGRLFIDDTTPIEQALPLQDITNQRGQQIKDNAEEVRGSKIFNKQQVNKEDAARFTNDPGSHLMTKGDVRKAATNLVPPDMPNWVVEDKLDARSEMDNIIGIHGPTRGERQGTDQPTTIQLLKEGDFQRASDLIAGIERMDEYSYRYGAHVMKLKYTEEHYEAVMGKDGRRTFIGMTAATIPQSGITVKGGTTLPTDKLSQREEAMELGKSDKIDNITFFERLGFPNPREQARKLFMHLADPATLYQGEVDIEEAEEDIERLKIGEIPEMPDEVTEGYMNTMVKFLQSDEFAELAPELQQAAQEYIQQVTEAAKTQLEEQPAAPVEQPQGMLQKAGGAVKSGINKLMGG